MDYVISFVIGLVISALILLLVDRTNLGLKVGGFGNAVIAALVIAIISEVVSWLITAAGIDVGGFILSTIVYFVVAALVLMLAARFLAGMKTDGFIGALGAALAIAILSWIVRAFIPGYAGPFGT